MMYKDLRGFIEQVEEVNLVRHIHGAHPNLEIGGITEVAAQLPECPALLFDRIVGYGRAGHDVKRLAQLIHVKPGRDLDIGMPDSSPSRALRWNE